MNFGFDIGISNIGWAVFDDENNQFVDAGVRKFSTPENPKTKEPLSKSRNEAKRRRKTLSRKKTRLNYLKQELVKELDLKIEDIENNSINNQWQLRVKALDEKLSPVELAKVLFHIAKHRNYDDLKYSISEDDETGKIKKFIQSNAKELENYRTPAEYLITLKGAIRNRGGEYTNSFAQSHTKKEFELIIKTQNSFGYKLNLDTLASLAFSSRALKSFEDKVGYCSFFKDEKRCAKNSPSGAMFIAYGKIINKLIKIAKARGSYDNNTKEWHIVDSNGVVLQPSDIINKIITKAMSINSYKVEHLKKDLNLEKDFDIPMHKDKKEFLNLSKLIEFKKLSQNLEIDLDDLAFILSTCKDENTLNDKLKTIGVVVDTETLHDFMSLNFTGFVDLSAKAIKLILPYFEQGYNYFQACELAHLEKNKSDIKLHFLPPLADYPDYRNSVTSISVIRSFSQFRAVLNALIEKYGSPSKIYFDLAREVGANAEARNKYEKEQKKNIEAIDKAKAECERLGIEANGSNIIKVRLWLEQNKTCAYSGVEITDEMIKRDNELEKSFIIPLSRSLDSSFNNQVLVLKKENLAQGDKLPFEAFDRDKFSKISKFADEVLKKNNYAKAKRLTTKFFEKRELGYLARHINDTSHTAVLIKDFLEEFLEFAPLKSGKKKHVISPSGSLKSAMRFYMGLGKKEMGTYYRHAIDACVVCLCSDGVIQKFSEFKRDLDISIYEQTSNELKLALREQDYKIKNGFELGRKYRENILLLLPGIFVSHKKEGRIKGEFHDQTIYSTKGLSDKDNEALSEGKRILIRGGFAHNAAGSLKRLDIFKDKQTDKYYGCPIYLMDYAKKKLPNRVFIGGGKQREIDENLEFCFSLVKNDLIKVQNNKMLSPILCYFNSYNVYGNNITIKTHNKKFDTFSEDEKIVFKSIDYKSNSQHSFGIVNLCAFSKMVINVLGEISDYNFTERQTI